MWDGHDQRHPPTLQGAVPGCRSPQAWEAGAADSVEPQGTTQRVTVGPAEDASKHPTMGCSHRNTCSSRAQKVREALTSLAQRRAPWTLRPDHTKTHCNGLFYSHLQSFSRRMFNDTGKCSWDTKLKNQFLAVCKYELIKSVYYIYYTNLTYKYMCIYICMYIHRKKIKEIGSKMKYDYGGFLFYFMLFCIF